MRVFLTGFMGAGKTAVGRPLAARLGVPFVDLDAEIEAETGSTVRETFEESGEHEFRRIELEVLKRWIVEPHVVLATGGGTLTQEGVCRCLEAAGSVVWLNPDFATILARLETSDLRQRPLFRDQEQARRLFESRLDVYRSSGVRVDIGSTETPEEVAARIERLLVGRASGLS